MVLFLPPALTHPQLKGRSERSLNVTQLHYMVWPDHGVPSEPSSLLAFHRRLKKLHQLPKRPILIHCRSYYLSLEKKLLGACAIHIAWNEQILAKPVHAPFPFKNSHLPLLLYSRVEPQIKESIEITSL